jgi:hypothetical protein
MGQRNFEKMFYSDGNKILESLESSVERSLVALDNLAMTITTVAKVSNQTFPFVNVPGFGSHVSKIASIVGTLSTTYCALVRFEACDEWEVFASGNSSALPQYTKETMQFQEKYEIYFCIFTSRHNLVGGS